MFVRTVAVLVAVCFFVQLVLGGVHRRDVETSSPDPLQELQASLDRIAAAARSHFANITGDNSGLSNFFNDIGSQLTAFGQQLSNNATAFFAGASTAAPPS